MSLEPHLVAVSFGAVTPPDPPPPPPPLSAAAHDPAADFRQEGGDAVVLVRLDHPDPAATLPSALMVRLSVGPFPEGMTAQAALDLDGDEFPYRVVFNPKPGVHEFRIPIPRRAREAQVVNHAVISIYPAA